MNRSELIENVYTCASCGFCRFGCPVYKEIGFESLTVRGRMLIFKKLLEGKIDYSERVTDLIYMCAQCENCNLNCPTGIDFVEICTTLREDIVQRGLLPESHKIVRENLFENSNPFGEPLEERGTWFSPKQEPMKKSKNLYFVGCTASYSLNRVAKSVVRILDKIEYDYTLLGSEEWCCGSPVFRMGEKEKGEQMIRHNVEKFRELGVETIFTSCAGCFRTLSKMYPEDFKVLHVVQLFDQLLDEGRLEFKKEFKKKILYYDGCDIGRHCGVYEEPRNVLSAIDGVELIELDYNREDAVCCGGPLASGFPELAHNIAARTVKEAEEKGADMIATACVSCLVNFKEGAKVAGIRMGVYDIPMLLPRFL